MKRVAEATVTPLVRFVEWLFGPHAPGIDLLLGLFAAAWGGLMLTRPHVFDRGAFVGLSWMPDAYWLGFFAVLTALHALGFFRLWLRSVRVAACLLSAWIWITVPVSLYRIELTTGVLIYPIIGCAALCGALYLSGQPRKVG
ncbi:hypothetical protein [Methylobacterium sp. Leaf85]|uniref:hypothetical protein n=1 Tax=Methylobacterium sp. Leaf85 TaxID=1736241 RepID=UPI0006F5D4D5|nr:hypothetical protein [Methylobacterium sp. Leaf85]KQO53087.1 hypothetical protein ASF08_19370 [Methylobacterium sp. Leaf85]